MPNEPAQQVQIALLRQQTADLKAKVEQQEKRFEEMEMRDRSRMRAAIMVLGGIAMSLATYIWATLVEGPRP
jgi:type VI protein secretion system component VasF